MSMLMKWQTPEIRTKLL